MKFLIDNCAGTKLANWLRDNGHDVLEAQSLGDDPGEQALLELAASSGRTLITIDSDFGRLIYRNQAVHAGLIRIPDVPPQQRINMVAEAISRYGQALEQHAIITIRNNRIRISTPPRNELPKTTIPNRDSCCLPASAAADNSSGQ